MMPPSFARDLQILILDELIAAPVRMSEHGPAGDGLSQKEHDAFTDMREKLATEQHQLSAKQHEWAKARHDELHLGDPAKRNANVPRGREVAKPDVLRNLPKKPPARSAKR